MRKIKRVLVEVLIITILSVAALSGCGNQNSNTESSESEIGGIHKSKVNKVIEYMDEKYSKFEDKFTVERFEVPGILNSYTSEIYYLSCETMPNVTISVRPKEDGYIDDYMIHRFLLEYEERVTPIYKEILGECKVFASSHNYSNDNITQDTTFEEYIKSEECEISDEVIALSEDAVNKSEEIAAKLKELSVPHGSVFIKVLKDGNDLSKLTDMNTLIQYEQDNNDEYSAGVRIELNKEFEITKSRAID